MGGRGFVGVFLVFAVRGERKEGGVQAWVREEREERRRRKGRRRREGLDSGGGGGMFLLCLCFVGGMVVLSV